MFYVLIIDKICRQNGITMATKHQVGAQMTCWKTLKVGDIYFEYREYF